MSSWVQGVDEAEATGELKTVYEDTRKKRGSVGNIYKAQSLNPASIAAHRELYLALFHHDGGLTRREREMIATAVSRANASEYCLAHHADALGRHSTEPGLPALVGTDYTRAPLSTRERALLDHAMKLTRHPDRVTKADVHALRAHGYSDAAILDATQVAAYVNYLNRVANGLGVTHDDVGNPYRY